MMILLLVVLLTCNNNHNGGVNGYSTGAGSCVGGMAAVGGSHFDNAVVLSGTLTEGKVIVTLDQQTVPSSTTTTTTKAMTTVQTNQDYTLSVTSNNPNGGFRGILIRMEIVPTTNTSAVESDARSTDDESIMTFVQWDTSMAQLADDVCSEFGNNVQGLTHVNNDEKKQVTSTVRWNTPGTVYIDITIVGANRASIGSIYGYERYPIQVIASPSQSAPSPSNGDIFGTLSPTYTPPSTTKTTSSASSLSLSTTTTIFFLITVIIITTMMINTY